MEKIYYDPNNSLIHAGENSTDKEPATALNEQDRHSRTPALQPTSSKRGFVPDNFGDSEEPYGGFNN